MGITPDGNSDLSISHRPWKNLGHNPLHACTSLGSSCEVVRLIFCIRSTDTLHGHIQRRNSGRPLRPMVHRYDLGYGFVREEIMNLRTKINLAKAAKKTDFRCMFNESQLWRAVTTALGYWDENGNPKSRRMKYLSGQLPKK